MSVMSKKAHVLCNGVQEDITLYSTLAEAQNMGKEFVVDGVTCYAKYGNVNDPLASNAKILIGGTVYSLLKNAQIPYGSVVYNSPGTYSFVPPAWCMRVRITACAGGGGGGGLGADGGTSSGPTYKIYPGMLGWKGASVNNRLISVASGNTYSITIGGGGNGGRGHSIQHAGDNGGTGGATYFGSLLGLAGGAGGRGGKAFGGGTEDSQPQEILISGYGAGGAGGKDGIQIGSTIPRYSGAPGQCGYMKLEWGGGI